MSIVERIIAPLATFVTAVISAGGYPGIVFLMAIESACVPLPSEIIMPFAGYLVSTGRFELWAVAVAGAIGCNVGSVVAYEVGRRGGRPFVARWGKYILVDMHDIDMAERFFARWGWAAMFIARLLPVIRTFIAFPAGVARMPLIPFHVMTFIGSLIWCYGLAWVGMTMGEAWRSDPRLSSILHSVDAVIVIIVLAIGGWWIWRKLRRIREQS